MAFADKVNHENSEYYVFNDCCNMESDETMHILTHFETYQQTTEYTCGTETPYDDVLIFADPYDITDHFRDGYHIFP